MAQRYGAATQVLDWRERLVCGQCGSRQADTAVAGLSAAAPRFCCLLAQTMIVGGFPMVVRLNN